MDGVLFCAAPAVPAAQDRQCCGLVWILRQGLIECSTMQCKVQAVCLHELQRHIMPLALQKLSKSKSDLLIVAVAEFGCFCAGRHSVAGAD